MTVASVMTYNKQRRDGKHTGPASKLFLSSFALHIALKIPAHFPNVSIFVHFLWGFYIEKRHHDIN
jgi:hypothetical protein